jgi:hypothetical protein
MQVTIDTPNHSSLRVTVNGAQTILDAIRSNIAKLRACKTDDHILAWPYGLAVRHDSRGAPILAVSLYDATPMVPGEYPFVSNGHGEPAFLVSRQEAIQSEIARAEGLLAEAEAAMKDDANA